MLGTQETKILRRLLRTIHKEKSLFDDAGGRYALVGFVAIVDADLNDKPHDISSLASWMDLPRSTCQRLLAGWEKEGYCVLATEGRRTVVYPTQRCHDLVQEYVDFLADNPVALCGEECPNHRD